MQLHCTLRVLGGRNPWSFLPEKWYYKTDIPPEASAWSTNTIGKKREEGRDARCIFVLKDRKKGPRPAAKAL